jgi:hypothetical protein
MLNAIPTPIASLILLEKNEPIALSGIKSLIHEFQLHPETAPNAETVTNIINKTTMTDSGGNINGLTAITSQQNLLKPAAITVINLLFRTFSTRNMEGN